jgi:hypothetical protein
VPWRGRSFTIVKPTTKLTIGSRPTLCVRLSFSHNDHQLIYPQCGLASSPSNYDWTLCDLRIHETLDTRLQLKMAEEGSGNKLKYWAYAPSLSVSKSAWTPKVVLFFIRFIVIFQQPFHYVCRIWLLSRSIGKIVEMAADSMTRNRCY